MKNIFLLPFILLIIFSCGEEAPEVEEIAEPLKIEWSHKVDDYYLSKDSGITDQYLIQAGNNFDNERYKIFYYNKLTGELEKTYIHPDPILPIYDVLITDEYVVLIAFEVIIVVDIQTNTVKWINDTQKSNSRGLINQNFLYTKTYDDDYRNLTRFDLNTGDYEIIHQVKYNSDLLEEISLPAFGKEETSDKEVIFFSSSEFDFSTGKFNLDAYALDLETQQELWSYHQDSVFFTNNVLPPLIVDNIVYHCIDDHIVAFDLTTGEKLWETFVRNEWIGSNFDLTEFLIVDHQLFFQPTSPILICLNLSDGSILWETTLPYINSSRHILHNDGMLIFSHYSELFFVDPANGEIIHRQKEPHFKTSVVYCPDSEFYFNGHKAFTFTKP